MKKVKITSLPQENNANSLLSILGLKASGIVRTINPISDLRVNDVLVDANKLHEAYSPMLVIKIAALTSLNVPSPIGIIVHIQRQNSTAMSSSQVIGQLFFSGGTMYYRTGLGNGTQINFTEWKAL